jgi:ribose transport system permease protein
MTKKIDITRLIRSQGPLVTLLVMCAVAACWFPDFRTSDNMANIFKQVSMTGLISIGMTFVILSGGIDLSVGSIAAVASVIAARLSGGVGLVAVLVPVIAGITIGAANGVLITRAKIPPFIATLSMMLGARGLAFIMADKGGAPVGADKTACLSQISKVDLLGVPWPAIIFVMALVVAIVVARYTPFGRSIYAIGGNEEAAIMMGLNVRRNKMLVYMICGGLAGVAGVLLTSRVNSGQPTAAAGWELIAIAAVVIGGTALTGGVGKMSHTLYGVLILGIIRNVINLYGKLDYWYIDLITGILLLAVVLLQTRIAGKQAVKA